MWLSNTIYVRHNFKEGVSIAKREAYYSIEKSASLFALDIVWNSILLSWFNCVVVLIDIFNEALLVAIKAL